jgi:hypothetical protein
VVPSPCGQQTDVDGLVRLRLITMRLQGKSQLADRRDNLRQQLRQSLGNFRRQADVEFNRSATPT